MLVVFLVFLCDFKLQVHPPSEPLPSFVYRGNSQVHVSKCLVLVLATSDAKICRVCLTKSVSILCSVVSWVGWYREREREREQTKQRD